MAAVLACGDKAVLSHESAAALWRIRNVDTRGELRLDPSEHIHVSLTGSERINDGIVVHRRSVVLAITHRDNIPVTTPIDTLIDLAVGADEEQIERDIDRVAVLRLATVAQIHKAATAAGRRPGAGRIRKLLDRQTLVLTTTELERLFVPIARRAGLPDPLTQIRLDGHRVDFYWPALRLIVETDGGSFHRTPAQQTRDRRHDQAHLAEGKTVVRFTHSQVRYESLHVEAVLRAVAARTTRPDPPRLPRS